MKIVHISDIHIHNSTKRYDEYRKIFEKLYNLIDKENPDRIVISGDLFHNYIEITNEAEILAGEFLKELSKRCKVILTLGNHDLRKNNLKRTPSPETVSKLMNESNIIYLDKSGFFEDDNIVWVNYSHKEKFIIPWKDIKNDKDENKIYIGLYHDPINGCKLPNGEESNSNKNNNLSIFKNDDLVLLGDIHLRQYLKSNIAYSGSLIQQNFGEKPYGHGGIIWEIDEEKNIKSKDFDIENDHVYLNFYLDEPDYDNLSEKNFESEYKKLNNEIKVHWKDYSSNINFYNEDKIKEIISNKYNINKNSVKFEKNYLNTSILSNEDLNENLDVNDSESIQKIFKSYLKDNKYSEKDIDELIKLDDIINNKIEFNKIEKDINWKIENFWFKNFRSYDEENINWEEKNGFYLLDGKNQHGKTTLFDAICYILFGTTLSTNKIGGAKREKYGDNRFLNNKRDLDSCEGGATINANGEKFIIFRKTNREWKKNKKEIKSVSTNVEYYIDSMKPENKQTGENKNKTQNKLNSIIGNFEDFIRITLTNSENLNQLLSIERSVFIDSVIRDAGYDIFEKKQEIFKEYKKQKLNNSVKIDYDHINNEIKEKNEKTNKLKIKIEELTKKIKEIKEEIEKNNNNKEKETKKLYKVDEDIKQIDINSLKNKLESYRKEVEKNIENYNSNLNKMKNLKKEFDEEKLNSLYSETKKLNGNITDLKLENSNIEGKILSENNVIDKIDSRIENLKDKEIQKNKDKIKEIEQNSEECKNNFKTKIKEKTNEIDDEIKDLSYKKNSLEEKNLNIKENGNKIKKDIKEIKNDDVCPVCNRTYDEKHFQHRENKIKELEKELEELLIPVKENITNIKKINKKIEQLKTDKQNIKDENYDEEIKSNLKNTENLIIQNNELIKEHNKIIKEIEDGDYENTPNLLQKIKEGLKLKENSLIKIKDFKDKISKNTENIESIKKDIELKNKEIYKLEQEQKEFRSWEYLNNNNNEIKLKNDNIKLTIENAKNKINKYNDQIDNINKNKIIEEKIEELNDKNDELQIEYNKFEEEKQKYQSDVAVEKNEIKNLNKQIEEWKEFIKKEELFKNYGKIISRDGIPTYLLKQSIKIINLEMEKYLTDVDFISYFDNDLNLKLSHKNSPNVDQNAIESSGKERTFIALSLKMALRKVNNKPKSNFLMLDEVMGKLKKESVEEFLIFLEKIKETIDKILIIEPNHPIDYDYLISIQKDESGISKLNIT